MNSLSAFNPQSNIRLVKVTSFVFLSIGLNVKAVSQTTIMVPIVKDNLIYHSWNDGNIKYVPLYSNIFSSENPRSIDYDPDN